MNNEIVILCPNCYTDNIEQHGGNYKSAVKKYICCECFIKFNNYDFILNNKIKYRMIAMEMNEMTYESIVKNSLKNIAFNGVLEHIGVEELARILRMANSRKENIINLSKLETNLKHFNDLKMLENN